MRGIVITDEMVEAALNACPLNYLQRRQNLLVRCSATTDDIRLMLEAALALVPDGTENAQTALEFYADQSNWIPGAWGPASATAPTGSITRKPSAIEMDRGNKARAVLAMEGKTE
jgi:hypothetical protein